MPPTREAGDAEFTPVLVEQRGKARWLRLNRPAYRNALNPELVAALQVSLGEALAAAETTVVVIAGEGDSFCAGGDLRYVLSVAQRGGAPTAFLNQVGDLFNRIEAACKPVIALVHGHVVAGGLELALACDVVVAQHGTLIGDGHVRNGLLPGGGGSVRLPRKVGEPLARWLMLTGELLPAEAFVPSGFVHAVASLAEVEATVTAIADLLTKRDARAQGRAKQLLVGWADLSVAEGLAREVEVFHEHWVEADIATALTRFVNRGVPEL